MVVQGVALESTWHIVACVISSALTPYVAQTDRAATCQNLGSLELAQSSAMQDVLILRTPQADFMSGKVLHSGPQTFRRTGNVCDAL